MLCVVLLCVLGLVAPSLCGNDVPYDYEEIYDNEITDQKHAPTPSLPECIAADVSRWDKLFVALENSQMRQNVLLEAVERRCGETPSLTATLAKANDANNEANDANAAELLRRIQELRDEGAAREKRLNATLHRLLGRSGVSETLALAGKKVPLLVAMATELQKFQLQLSRAIEEARRNEK